MLGALHSPSMVTFPARSGLAFAHFSPTQLKGFQAPSFEPSPPACACTCPGANRSREPTLKEPVATRPTTTVPGRPKNWTWLHHVENLQPTKGVKRQCLY